MQISVSEFCDGLLSELGDHDALIASRLSAGIGELVGQSLGILERTPAERLKIAKAAVAMTAHCLMQGEEIDPHE